MSETSPPYDATHLPADVSNWLESVRRAIDAAKVSVCSASPRLNETDLAKLASRLEQVAKDCRALVLP